MTDFERWKALDRTELERLYETLPMPAIAAQFGVNTSAVAYRLKTWGIQKKGRHPPGPKKAFNPPIDELANLYRQMSMAKLAAHYGVGETVIFTRIKEAGLPYISRAERLKGVPKTETHIEAMRKAQTGNNRGDANPNWKGGITKESNRQRSSMENKQWKATVLARANQTCQRCGVGNGSRCDCCGHIIRLHVHHVKSFKDYPALRFDPDNGEALCEKCHYIEHHGKSGELLGSP